MTHNNTPDRVSNESTLNQGVTRRQMINRAAKTGIAMGIVGSLIGCSSSAEKRVNKKGGSLGQPIPEDPIAHTSNPRPYSTIRRTAPTVSANEGLASIPSFVTPRKQWTSSGVKKWLADPMTSVSRITVHHDAIMPVPGGSYAESLRRLQLIRKGHLNNGWADIGYHFAIDPKGRIWQARPLDFQGAHVKDHNVSNLGIVMFGNYEQINPTSASVQSLDKLIAYAMKRFMVPMSRVYTHRELRPTACPGRNLQAQMNQTRSNSGRLSQMIRTDTPVLLA